MEEVADCIPAGMPSPPAPLLPGSQEKLVEIPPPDDFIPLRWLCPSV